MPEPTVGLDELPSLGEPLVIHVVAVGGAGMSPIATVLAAMGHRVSGSDLRDSVVLDRLRALLGACLAQGGLAPEIGQEAIQMQTIVALVSAGMGIALVPQSVSNLKRPGVVYRKLREPTPSIETGFAWRRDNPSPVLRAFLSLLSSPKRKN